MRLSIRNILSQYVIFPFFFLVSFAAIPMISSAQTPTTIQVTSTVLQHSVKRLGINLGDQSYWDSGQMLKNLIFGNSGFEGMKYRSTLHCTAVTANTCQDSNQYTSQGTDFWTGGTYRVISGSAMGRTGTVVKSVNNRQSCGGCGQVVTFDSNISLAVGDYVTVTNSFPGNAQERWWTSTGGNATLTTEFNDLSPETQGKQALRVTATGASDSASVTTAWDTMDNETFIQMNGHYNLSFRAKGVGSANKVSIIIQRLTPGEAPYLQQTVTLNPTWTDYNLNFTANESGYPIGHIQLVFQFKQAAALLDDVSVTQTDSDPQNTTAFRDDVVNTLKDLHPGVLRMNAGAAIGVDLYDQIAPPFARYREGTFTSSNIATDIPYGLQEFLELCSAVGADPWITIPLATTPQELTDFMDYLQGSGSTTYSAMRVAQGQTAPWTSVFSKIHIELGNETWNGAFAGETMSYPAYSQWANQVFGAARKSPGFNASKFDFVLSGIAASAGYNQGVLQYSTQHDSIDIAPYQMYSANDIATTNQFQALLAEPEMFNSAGGEVYQNMTTANKMLTAASGTSQPTKLNVYELNMSTVLGTITQAEATQLIPSLGAGIAITDNMLQMMRLGVVSQNTFSLPGFKFVASNGNTVPLWGFVVDMGTKNLRRPSFLAQALANTAISGDMLQTVQGGANPTWNQPLSSDNVQFAAAHFIQSFAFLNGNSHSVVLLNLNLTSALPVTFSGPNAPSGTVQVSQLNSANVTDNNETSNAVQVASTTATISSTTPYSLPPHSMTVLTWSGSGSETAQAAAPAFSVPGGTYTNTQTVSISDGTAGATIYYTTNGSTPTTSSTKYSSPITVSSSETLTAIAVATNFTNSAPATAAYVISTGSSPSSGNPPPPTPVAAVPVFTPAGGAYTAVQSVKITDTTAASTIYYTTDGSTPTTSSAKYSSAITVGSTETLKAIAIASGYTNSSVASAAYTITLPSTSTTPVFDFGNGFTGSQSQSQFSLNGNAKWDGSRMQLTDGNTFENSSAWYATPVNVQSFTTDIGFQLTNAVGDGFTFAIQSVGPQAMGSGGAGLGYHNLQTSIGLKIDLHNNAGEGPESTGLYTNGAVPMGTAGSVSLVPSGIDIHSGHAMTLHLVYDGTNLTMTLTDTVTKVAFKQAFPVNIPSIIGSHTGYVGFTGASGGIAADQEILSWTYSN